MKAHLVQKLIILKEFVIKIQNFIQETWKNIV